MKKGIGTFKRCVCPNCGYTMEKPLAIPCYAVKCPRCGSPMHEG